MMRSQLLFAEGAAPTHATVQASVLDWVVWVGVVPAVVVGLLMWWNRGHKVPSLKRAGLQSLLAFSAGVTAVTLVWIQHGSVAGQEYLTGWFVELSLSVDNVFTWGVVVGAFLIWKGYHQTLILWGVLMAIVLRVAFILFGVALLTKFWWVLLVLAAILVYVGIKIQTGDDEPLDIKSKRSYRVMTKVLPIAEARYGTAYVTRQEGGLKATQFLLAIIMFGVIDVMFAFDSIPAILAVATDPFIIISSNMMALIGLQALYFLYDGIKSLFTKLNEVLAWIMYFVAAKIIIGSELFEVAREHLGWWPSWLKPYHPPTFVSLGVIIGLLAFGIVWSMVSKDETEQQETASMDEALVK